MTVRLHVAGASAKRPNARRGTSTRSGERRR
jgi:hypothetical protein